MLSPIVLSRGHQVLDGSSEAPSICLLQRKLQLSYSVGKQLLRQLEAEGESELTRFIAVVRATLGGPDGYLHKSGATLYSEPRTLRRGQVYLLGTNPGGGDEGKNTIEDALIALPMQGNAYLDEIWDTGRAAGEAVLQRRVKNLLEDGLGLQTRDVCATNLVFQRTKRVAGLSFREAADACWPIHEHLLDVVQPRLVVAFGNSTQSAYAYLAKKLPKLTEIPAIKAQHGDWECRGFHTTWQGRPMRVVGLPHMSYYSPTDASGAVKAGLREFLRLALAGESEQRLAV